MGEKKFLDKILDLFFDKTKSKIMLITLFGFILRLIAAINIGVNPDDVNHAISPIGIFGSEKLANYGQSTALWYYIQGAFYKLFGATQVISRLANAIFGSLLIVLMFLFVKKVFKSEKAAMISSFLIAVSPMLIKSTLPEMDVVVSFFILFSAYFLFDYFESRSNKKFIMMGVLIGVAMMIKLYALFFAFSFLLFFIYKEAKSKEKKEKIIKKVILFGIILIILVSPTFIYNYLLYKDKGFMDLMFTNIFKLGLEKAKELYSWNAGWMAAPDFKGFFLGNEIELDSGPFPGFLILFKYLFLGDPILFVLGFLGLVFAFKKNRDYFWFFLLAFLPAFVYLGAVIPMIKHLIWTFVLLAPLAGNFVENFSKNFVKIKLRYVLLIILIFSLFYFGMPDASTQGHFYGQSPEGQVMNFKEKNIPDNALIVADSRIYRGTIHWMLNGRNYIEAAQFFSFANELNKKGNLQSVEVYYVECVTDDCGWSTVKDQPEFNKSMEDITAWFAQQAVYSEDIKAPDRTKYYFPIISEKTEQFKVYKTNLMLNPLILDAAKSTHTWFMYPIGYDRKISPIFDDYNTGGFGRILEKLAWIVLYFELVFSFFAIIYILYLFLKYQNEAVDYNSSIQRGENS